ncbi:hypothetical protein ABLQ08_26660, partial [Roseibium sp. SCPC14]
NADGEALCIRWDDGTDSGELRIANLGDHIERFEFADGTVLSDIDLNTPGRAVLTGTDGADIIIGSSQNDTIIGGNGADTLTGGAGDDIFVFEHESGNDRVKDFTDGEDLIRIESGASAFADLVLEASGQDALVKFGSTTITLEDVLLSELDQGDFLFS